MNQIPQDNQGPVDVVIMAAGKGTRMKSRLPKVLHRLAGRALLGHVTDTAARIGARHVVVVTGHGAAEVEAAMAGNAIGAALQFARQEPQLGTGHAVQQAAPLLPDDGTVLVLSGDVPLIGEDTLRALIAASGGRRLALLTIEFYDPTGYGRIVRAEGQAGGEVKAIVEQKDATEAQRGIREIYSGVMAVPAALLKGWLSRLDNRNAQGEYYLTDIVKLAAADGVPVVAHVIDDALQVAGINSPAQLAALERAWQLRQAEALMAQGVRLADPARFDLRGALACEADVEIDVNCVFEGSVFLGEGVRVGANCVIANARIEAGAVIHPFTHIDGEKAGVTVGERALVGPSRGCGRARSWAPRCTSATSSRSRTRPWPRAPRPITWPTWAMPAWADASITARAASRPTTTAPTSTAPSSRTTCTWAATACWWRRSPLARAAPSAAARR